MTQLQADILDFIIIEGWATAEEIANYLRLDVARVEAELEELRLDGQIIEDGFEEIPLYDFSGTTHCEPLFKYIGGPISRFFAEAAALHQ
jgi:hypothetical protein